MYLITLYIVKSAVLSVAYKYTMDYMVYVGTILSEKTIEDFTRVLGYLMERLGSYQAGARAECNSWYSISR